MREKKERTASLKLRKLKKKSHTCGPYFESPYSSVHLLCPVSSVGQSRIYVPMLFLMTPIPQCVTPTPHKFFSSGFPEVLC